MAFELVRLGWPNTVVVLALAAVPFMSLGLPSGQPTIPSHVESIHPDEQNPIGVASIAEE